MKSIRFILIILLFSAETFSQQDEFIISHMQSSDEFAYHLTYTMLQDNHGYLWFGTMYGLLRYDGLQTILFRNDIDDSTSIGFDDIVSLFQDKKGNLWIGTWGGGLVKYSRSTGNFETFLSTDKTGLSDNIIWAITEDPSGNIWIGTQSGGISVYSPSKNIFTKLHNDGKDNSNIPMGYISSLTSDSKGNIWVGTPGGLYKYTWSDKKFKKYILEENTSTQFQSNNITTVNEFDNQIWIGTRDGLFLYQQPKNTFIKYNLKLSNLITSISQDNKGYIWLSTGRGLTRFNPSNNYTDNLADYSKDEFLKSYIGSMMIDKSGVIWACSYTHDLIKISYKQNTFATSSIKDSVQLFSANILSFTSEQENVWIGTSKGLLHYDINSGVTSEVTSLNKYPLMKAGINSLLKSRDELLVGTHRGLFSYNLLSQDLTAPKHIEKLKQYRITSLVKDKSNKLWVGTYSNGIFVYDYSKDSLIHHDLTSLYALNENSNYILTIFEDKSGRIWVGTYAGLYLFGNNQFTSFHHDRYDHKSISNNYVYTVFEDSKNRLWIGTAKGLNLFNEKAKYFSSFYQKDGLPNDVISGITEDNYGFIWISTLNGISKFDFEKKKFEVFNKQDGLPGNYFNPNAMLNTADGKILAGTRSGLAVINPSLMQNSSTELSVLLSSVTILKNESEDERVLNAIEGIELSYENNSIKILLSSTDYNNPGKTKFRYRLNKGLWNHPLANEILLTDLSAGEYELEIKAIDALGIESSETKPFIISVIPPFWQTWWFIILTVVVVLLSVYAIHKIVLRKKIKRTLEIEKIKNEASEKVRKKTAIDFHDELGHRLTRISLVTGMIRRKLQNKQTDLNSLLDKINENSTALYDGTKDFIWSIDPTNDSLYELMIRLKDFGDDLFTDGQMNFEVKGLSEGLSNTTLDMDWKRHIALILKEGMNNSLKHSHGTKVSLETRVLDDELQITLEDDGIGIVETKKTGNGLRNMKKRAEKLNASLELVSVHGKGTKIFFKGKFPGKSVNYN